MMGKTHVAIGIMTSLLLSHATNFQECAVAVAGGALGGVIADIDTVNNDYKHDALIGQLTAIGITGIVIVIDFFLKFGICQSTLDRNRILTLIGIVMLMILAAVGFFSRHRTFTHSLLAMLLFSISVWLICPVISVAYIFGYMSHLFLDVLNKKDVPLLYPRKGGLCLKWFYAGKKANTVFMFIGIIGAVLLVVIALI